MTNLQDVPDSNASGQQRLLLVVPIALGAVIAALIVGVGVVPPWLKLQANSERLADLEDIQARIPRLRAQIDGTAVEQEVAERKQARVLQLIVGSGERLTFLAQMDREASRHGVQLDFYEPTAPVLPNPEADAKKAANNNKDDKPVPASPKEPLEAAGLKAQRLLVTARGSYPGLLAFLQATERLSLLVKQTELALAAVPMPEQLSQAGGATAALPGMTGTELKLMLTFYEPTTAITAEDKPKQR